MTKKIKIFDNECWICFDCVLAVVNDDFSGIDYHYTEKEAQKKK